MGYVLNEGALNANRSGRLSLSQGIGLLPLTLVGGIMFLIGAGISGGIIYSVIAGTFKGSLIAAVIIGGGVSAAFILLGYLLGGKRLIDIYLGQVRTVDGSAIKFSEPGDRGGRVLYFSVGKDNFQVPWYRTWEALPHDGAKVRAYYTPVSRSLVNVESSSYQPGVEKDEELDELKQLEKAVKK